MSLPIWAGKHLWIWMLSAQDQGNLQAIIQQAKNLGLRGLIVKAADGPFTWSQFNQPLVDACHAAGLTIGAWVFVYGDNVPGEIAAAEHALALKPDWFIIDAESAYVDKPQQALTYGAALQKAAPSIPLAYAPMAIPSYHATFPYAEFSHFCQVVMPQQYWADIGWTVDYTFTRSTKEIAAFGRPVAPVGQSYLNATAAEIAQFSDLVSGQGLDGFSFWDWQSAPPALLQAVAYAGMIQLNAKGAAVQTLQTMLGIAVDGIFGPETLAAVKTFQKAHNLVQDGVVGPATWSVLWTVHSEVAPQPMKSVLTVPDAEVQQIMADIKTLRAQANTLAQTFGKDASALKEDGAAIQDLNQQIQALEATLRSKVNPPLYQETAHRAIYVALNGTLHHVPNMKTFDGLGFAMQDVQHVKTLPLPIGDPLASL